MCVCVCVRVCRCRCECVSCRIKMRTQASFSLPIRYLSFDICCSGVTNSSFTSHRFCFLCSVVILLLIFPSNSSEWLADWQKAKRNLLQLLKIFRLGLYWCFGVSHLCASSISSPRCACMAAFSHINFSHVQMFPSFFFFLFSLNIK